MDKNPHQEGKTIQTPFRAVGVQLALQTWVLNWVLSKELGGLASESEVHWSAYQNLLLLFFFFNLKQWYILKQVMKPKIIFYWIPTTT